MTQRPLVKNSGDREQVREAETRMRLADRQAVDDLRFVLQTPAGRRFIWRQLERGGPFTSPYRTNSLDMAHACGLSDQARRLWAECFEHCPDLLLVMAKENDASRDDAGAGDIPTQTRGTDP